MAVKHTRSEHAVRTDGFIGAYYPQITQITQIWIRQTGDALGLGTKVNRQSSLIAIILETSLVIISNLRNRRNLRIVLS